jgi:hypothetical protein
MGQNDLAGQKRVVICHIGIPEPYSMLQFDFEAPSEALYINIHSFRVYLGQDNTGLLGEDRRITPRRPVAYVQELTYPSDLFNRYVCRYFHENPLEI